ncbi:hypothetical protein [Aestuariivirga sp.]|uniref:hypothetical protein n=1 Tax=Aestuariivirga sp. TaxID=2650926 RepID=UPI0035943AFD
MELDPLYCDCILRRWQTFARDDVILAATGETFEQVEMARKTAAATPQEVTPQP